MNYYHPLTDTISASPAPNTISVLLGLEDSPFSENSSLVKGTQIQFALDSTSLGLLKTCPRKYFYALLQGWVPKEQSINLSFGIFFHRVIETWHRCQTVGQDPAEAYISMIRLAGLLGEALPPSSNTTRTKETLVRAACWYMDQFSNDPARTLILPSGKPAVELSFQFPLTEIDDVTFYLCGHIDRLVEFQGDLYFTDIKSTQSALNDQYFSQFNPSNQMSIYALASQVILDRPAKGGVIDAVQLGVNFVRLHRQTIPINQELIEETIRDLKSWIRIAIQCSESGNWPKNEESCQKRGGCEFQEICRLAPSKREIFLRGKFHQRLWDPLTPR
jgi:PD-(D/E)XK nuclease superfamily